MFVPQDCKTPFTGLISDLQSVDVINPRQDFISVSFDVCFFGRRIIKLKWVRRG